MMIIASMSHRKNPSPTQSPTSLKSQPNKGESTATYSKPSNNSRGICRGLNDCMTMGSTVSTPRCQQHHHNSSKLEQQVADLEREVMKQKELRIMYRKRMERTQDYLKYCLQIAQDNGFLGLIVKPREDQPEVPLPSKILITTNSGKSDSPTPSHQNSDLALTINQAKMSGWYIDPNEIDLQQKVGEGSTATIYRAIWRGLDVAVKCINASFFHSNESGVTFFAQELDTLSRQRHRFVIQLMGACLEPPNFAWVVTEYMSMTLKEWLHGRGTSRRKERIIPIPSFEERINRALEIAQAMQYLHDQNPKVIHRDLKPSNIFLDDANHVRVADFGHARFLTDDQMALTGETGTYIYMAPEVIRCEPYNEKCDVYSFAIVLNELVTGGHPYIETDSGPSKIAMEVAEGKLRPRLPEDNGKIGELIDLITLAWNQDASLRPSFASITSALRKFQRRPPDSYEYVI